jgi:hypothetical protein
VGTNLQIVFLRVWETADDPWEETSAFGRFNEFRSYWNANMTGTLRDAAHFLSGIPLSGAGGLGYAPGLCVPEFDYALSAHLNGFFPYPLEDHHSDNWDVLVVSHELGHNFGAPHTHSMSPPVDCCGCNPQDCSDAHNGTIMSYCHICEGGVANILLIFHVRTVTEAIIPYLSGLDCLPGESGPVITQHPADASPCEGESVTFTVTASGPGVLTYQWHKDGEIIDGAVSPSYTIASVTEADAGMYDVVVDSACGSVTSLPAQLTIGTDCCPWDLDGDLDVSTSDLLLLLGNWGGVGVGDINGDGIVSTSDLLALVAHWGFCP